jgi:hypothetical protein
MEDGGVMEKRLWKRDELGSSLSYPCRPRATGSAEPKSR